MKKLILVLNVATQFLCSTLGGGSRVGRNEKDLNYFFQSKLHVASAKFPSISNVKAVNKNF